MQPRVLFLVISSDDVPQYFEMRNCLHRYLSRFSNVKHLFLDAGNGQSCESLCERPSLFGDGPLGVDFGFAPDGRFAKSSNDVELSSFEPNVLVCTNVRDCIRPGILFKTLLGMNYVISEGFEFDYVVRTNLSTMWNMPVLCNLLASLPLDSDHAIGTLMNAEPINQAFLSGTGIVLSRSVVEKLIRADVHDYRLAQNDDVAIGHMLEQNHVSMIDWTQYGLCMAWLEHPHFLDVLKTNSAKEEYAQHPCFRCKVLQDRNIDVAMMTFLAELLV